MPKPQAGSAYPIGRIRADFPILATQARGRPLLFLDSAASAQKPQAVIDSIAATYAAGYANIHRGLYDLSQRATDAFEAAREKLRAFINARETAEVILLRGATEAINLVAQSWGRANLSEGDEMIISAIEHHANIVPWHMLRVEKGVVLKIIPVKDNGELDFAAFKSLITPRTRLLALTHVSNALGTVVPVEEYIAEARRHGIAVLVDGCQGATHMPVDVAALGADFYVFSGHKLYGPSGTGVLYGRRELLEAMPPWQGGGEMIRTVRFEEVTYNDLPFKFEAGTPAIAEVIGLGAAVDYVASVGMGAIHAHEMALTAHALERLAAVPGLYLMAPGAARASIIPFNIEGLHASDVGMLLDQQGVAVRTGHHCAMPVMERFGVPASVRASFGMYNTHEEVEALGTALDKITRMAGNL